VEEEEVLKEGTNIRRYESKGMKEETRESIQENE